MTREDQTQPRLADAVSGQRPGESLSVRSFTARSRSALLESLSGSPWAGTLLHASTVVLLYSAFYTAFFSIALLDGRVLALGDSLLIYAPMFYGEHALWTTDLFSGFPVAADPQSMAWYPVAWLFALFPGSFAWFVISAYVLGSSFTYAYIYAVTDSRLAAVVGGLTYGCSGFFFAHLGHVPIMHVAAWLPAIFWALESLRRSPGRTWLAGLAIAVTISATAGHTQIFFYALLASAAYALVRGWGAAGGWPRYYALSLTGTILGLGMAAVLLLPAHELLGESTRPSLTFDFFSGFALPWRQLPQLAFPFLFGSHDGNTYYSAYFGDPRSNSVESTGFVGLVPPTLAFAGLWLSRRSTLVCLWTAIAAIALLLALGDSTPLERLLFHVPFYDLFRGHGRLLIIVTFAVSVLAGLGTATAQRVAQQERNKAFLSASVAVVTAMLTVVVGLLIFSDTYRWWAQFRGGLTHVPVLPWENAAIGIPLLMLAIGLAALWIWVRRPAAWSSLLLLAVLVMDLGSYGWFNYWRDSVSPSVFDRPSALVPYRNELTASGQRLMPLLGVAQPVELAPPCVTRLWGLPSASGCNPFITKRYDALTGMGTGGLLAWPTLTPENAVLDILAVRYLFVPELPAGSPVTQLLAADPSRWRPAQDLPTGSAYSNERALPRAWLANEIMTLTPDQVLDAIQHSTLPDGRKFDPATTALLEEPVDFADRSSGDRGIAKVIHQADTSLKLQIETDSAALLVLSDTYYPGWTATVDGESTHIYRTNYVLRGIEVPPGSHTVQFEYRPKSFVLGAGVSAASALILTAVLAWPLIRRLLAAAGPAAQRAFRRGKSGSRAARAP